MTTLLLLASLFAAVATVLVVRLVTLRHVRTAHALGRISEYGFAAADAELVAEAVDRDAAAATLPDLSAQVGRLLPAQLRQRDDAVRAKLVSAGLYRVTPAQYYGYRTLSIGLALVLALWAWVVLSPAPAIGLLLGIVLLASGWFLPEAELKRRRAERLASVDRALPDLVDFLVVTVEAGIGFPAALQAASARFPEPLGEELRLLVREQRMGLSVEESLRNMLARTDTPGMSSFVRSLVQGETLGVSIGQILRSLAAEMRKRRRQMAEEQAQKAPIKMMFPLAFLIFPALFIVVLGPAVYDFLHTFGGH